MSWNLRLGIFTSLLLAMCNFSMTGADSLTIAPGGDQHLFSGDRFFVSCYSEAKNVQRVMWTGPSEDQITDYTGSVAQNKIARIYVEDGRSGPKGVDLVFENVTTKDKGRYICSANVDGKEEEVGFEMFVHKNIDFGETPTVQYLEEERDSTLQCNVDGEPLPRIHWNVNKSKVRMGDKYQKDPENPSNLIVKNVSLEDAGVYSCQAFQLTSSLSNMDNLEINVKVHHKPRSIVNNDDQAYSYVNGNVNLTCEANAEPKANFTWMKNDETLAAGDNVQVINFPNKSILQLGNVNEDMFGAYVCVAENHLGTMERVVILSKGSKPPQPSFEVIKAEVNGMQVSLESNGHSEMPVSGFRVQYKKAGDSWEFAESKDFNKDDTYTIEDLDADTLYTLRAYAKNAAGLSDYTDEVLRRTSKVEAKNLTSGASALSFVFSTTISSFLVTLLLFL